MKVVWVCATGLLLPILILILIELGEFGHKGQLRRPVEQRTEPTTAQNRSSGPGGIGQSVAGPGNIWAISWEACSPSSSLSAGGSVE